MRLSKLQFLCGQEELREICAKIEGISDKLYLTKLNFFFHIKSFSSFAVIQKFPYEYSSHHTNDTSLLKSRVWF